MMTSQHEIDHTAEDAESAILFSVHGKRLHQLEEIPNSPTGQCPVFLYVGTAIPGTTSIDQTENQIRRAASLSLRAKSDLPVNQTLQFPGF